MDMREKMKCIRLKLNLTQQKLADMMGVSRSHINQIENGNRPIKPYYIKTFKDAINAPLLPLIEKEETQFIQKLHEWKDKISSNEVSEAKEWKPQLARCAELTTSDEIKNLYTIFSLAYYRLTNEMETYNSIMDQLKQNAEGFNDEQAYWFMRQIGINELYAFNYKTAYNIFLEAEKKGSSLNTNNEGIYFNISRCLTEMGFASKAIEYIEESQKQANKEKNHSNDNNRRFMLVKNLIAINKTREALEILNGCLREERKNVNESKLMSQIYRQMALAYLKMDDYDNAKKNIDISFNYIDENKSSYANNLYYKSIILLADGQIDKGIECLDQCIKIEKEGTYHNILYNATRHSMTMENNASPEYIENIAIPKFQHHHVNLVLIKYYKIMCDHYRKKNKMKALMYSERAFILSEKLREGVLT
ncbi:MAG: helix-turn-helix transcriptional regulator [Defluviitaleaceae bacterium]|nr:helix-turn-helix transcriptional regulator [Defluviitaleaceae bacterium]